MTRKAVIVIVAAWHVASVALVFGALIESLVALALFGLFYREGQIGELRQCSKLFAELHSAVSPAARAERVAEVTDASS